MLPMSAARSIDAIISDCIGSTPVKVKLYTVPASHPGKTAAAMLAHKGIPYKRTDLLPFVSRTAVRVIGFPDKTVPAMVIDGRKIQKSRAIGQELDRIQPDPPLYPSDPDQLKKVLEAERFGDEELQSNIRRIVIWGVRHSPEARLSYLQESKLPLPLGLAAKTGGPLIALAARQNEASDEKTRPYLAALPALLQRVDDEIAAGTIDGEELNAADFQIAGSIRLALTMRDLRPFIDSRPAGRFARRVIPDFAGDMPEVIPPEWLEPSAPPPLPRRGLAALGTPGSFRCRTRSATCGNLATLRLTTAQGTKIAGAPNITTSSAPPERPPIAARRMTSQPQTIEAAVGAITKSARSSIRLTPSGRSAQARVLRRRDQAIGIPISCAQAPIQIVEIARAPISWIAVMRLLSARTALG